MRIRPKLERRTNLSIQKKRGGGAKAEVLTEDT